MSGKPHILIVDDNINLCKTTSLILKRKGYAVTMAQDGVEAIERVKEQALRNNAYTCLYKPLDIEELLRLIEGIWQKKSGGLPT